MKLYMLEWDRELGKHEYETTLLGVFTSKKQRNAAKKEYKSWPTQWPFFSDGKFLEWEAKADDLLIPKRVHMTLAKAK